MLAISNVQARYYLVFQNNTLSKKGVLMRYRSLSLIMAISTSLIACGKDDAQPSMMMTPSGGETVESGGMMDGGMMDGEMMSGEMTSGEPSDNNNAECTAQVEIGFFSDPECTQLVTGASPTRVYDTTQSCFSWEGNSAAGENSATRFQCFRDRVCYTQHPATLSCDNPTPTNKEARTDECVLDTQTPDGSRAIYAKIIGGTEGCPEAPADFECPLSEPQQGTTGIEACSMEP